MEVCLGLILKKIVSGTSKIRQNGAKKFFLLGIPTENEKEICAGATAQWD